MTTTVVQRDGTYGIDDETSTSAASVPPLVVDLDGTLVFTDMLHESALRLFSDGPLQVARIPLWLVGGKAVLKRRLAERLRWDVSRLPYNDALIAWLRTQRASGRRLVLCTAADASIAEAIAAHLALFDTVVASDGVRNLSGAAKADALDARYGRGRYDYVGNATSDLAVWSHARRAVVVNGSRALVERARRQGPVERVFPRRPVGLDTWRHVLRVHQWLKNALLLVPLLAAHRIAEPAAWGAIAVAFVAFSLCASAVYIANDLTDLESDRRHPRKRRRPFASGRVAPGLGLVLAPLLLGAALLLATRVGHAFTGWLACYFVVTCAYSWFLKRYRIVDCLTLAVLHTLRIVAGAAAAAIALSSWLLAFSACLFLSLAFVKRYAELALQVASGPAKVHGRGYTTSDVRLVHGLGLASGFASVLVLALYLDSDAVVLLYRMPAALWGAVPVMLLWIGWIWLQARRGRMHDDPLVFAVKDGASRLAGVALVAVLVVGAVGVPW